MGGAVGGAGLVFGTTVVVATFSEATAVRFGATLINNITYN